MQQLGIQMGVFVASSIDWKKPTLTTGKQEIRDKFLSEIRESVEVAKRVNAKWMTVVAWPRRFATGTRLPDGSRRRVAAAGGGHP